MLKKLLKKEISPSFLLIPYSIILLLSYFVTGNLFFEWIVSFMPYFLVINIFLIVFSRPRKRSFTHFFLYGITILMLMRVVDFGFIKPPTGNGTKELKVIFLNKLIFNTNYGEIDRKVRNINPDILGMAEISETDIKGIPVLKEYPYAFIKQTPNNAPIALFSKYMFSVNNSIISPYTLSSKMYIYGNEYYVFVTHPIAPISFNTISQRNSDIKEFSIYLNSLENARVIVLGDFNITPWSPFYIKYISRLKNMKNAAKGTGLYTTYHQDPFRVLIDHIFVSNEFKVEYFNVEFIEGSDHKLIWTKLKI